MGRAARSHATTKAAANVHLLGIVIRAAEWHDATKQRQNNPTAVRNFTSGEATQVISSSYPTPAKGPGGRKQAQRSFSSLGLLGSHGPLNNVLRKYPRRTNLHECGARAEALAPNGTKQAPQ